MMTHEKRRNIRNWAIAIPIAVFVVLLLTMAGCITSVFALSLTAPR